MPLFLFLQQGQPIQPCLIEKSKTDQTTDKKWSGRVTRESHALELEEGVFTWEDPRRIARSLKRSAEASTQRKPLPFNPRCPC